jgi:hypothetical protein
MNGDGRAEDIFSWSQAGCWLFMALLVLVALVTAVQLVSGGATTPLLHVAVLLLATLLLALLLAPSHLWQRSPARTRAWIDEEE